MKTLRLTMLWSAILLLFIAITIGQAQEQPVFRIGILDAERGAISNGARLAVSQINDAGGVEGADGTVFRLELIVQSTDEADSLATAVDAIDRASVVAVIGPETTEQVLSNLPLLQSLQVPILTPAIGDTVVASDSTGVIFRTRGAERLQGFALAEYLVTELNINDIVTVQLDRNSTASRVGFSVALSQLSSNANEETLLLEEGTQIADLVEDIINSNTQIAVTYGQPTLASDLYNQLRGAGWVGLFAYNQASDAEFNENISLDSVGGIFSTTTWAISADDAVSETFTSDFVKAFGQAPGPVEASTYDAINMLAIAIGQPGELTTNLINLNDFRGVQGILRPAALSRGELSDNVAVIQTNSLGGFDVEARYLGFERLPNDEIEEPEVIVATSEPTATPTPDGVVITIESNRQNVRTGPGLEYDVLGQMQQGEQAQVIGATIDFSWVVILYRGQQGWLATYLLDVFGDRSTVPVIAPPPTPTPPPATATPTPPPVADIVVVSASPANVTLGATTPINVTIQNIGSLPAGAFAVAVTYPPDDFFSAVNLTGLGAGQQQVISLPIQATVGTGIFNATIIADLNTQVSEGSAGEANNDDFVFEYRVDRQLILINNTTLNTGNSIDLEGNLVPDNDITYTGAGLNTVGVCTATTDCIGLISPTQTWETSHYDALNSGVVNTTFIANAALTPGATIGIFTAEGRRGVIRVDSINPGVSITLTYRVYQ